MDETQQVDCTTCGTSGPAAKRFCTACGTPRVAVPSGSSETSVPGQPSAPTAVACTSCGSDVVPGKRFCTACGHPTGAGSASAAPETRPVDLGKPGPVLPSAPLPPTPLPPTQLPPAPLPPAPLPPVRPQPVQAPVHAPPPPSLPPLPSPALGSQRPRRRARVLTAVVVLVLLLGTAGVAAVLLIRDGEAPGTATDLVSGPSPTAPAEPVETVTVTVDPGPTESVSTVAPAEPSTSPATVAPADRVRCWNDRPAPSVGDCTAPTGRQGLMYVFDGFDFAGEDCDTFGVRIRKNSRFHYRCEKDGVLWFNISQFDSQNDGIVYYRDDFGSMGSPVRGDLLQWERYTGDYYKTALLYATGRWGVTIYSPDLATRNSAVADLKRQMVPASELRGRPTR